MCGIVNIKLYLVLTLTPGTLINDDPFIDFFINLNIIIQSTVSGKTDPVFEINTRKEKLCCSGWCILHAEEMPNYVSLNLYYYYINDCLLLQ